MESREAPKPYERIFQCSRGDASVNDKTGGLAGHDVRPIRSTRFSELLRSETYRAERAAAIGRAQGGEKVRLVFDAQDTEMTPTDEAAFKREAADLRQYGIDLQIVGVRAADATRAKEALQASHRIGVTTQDQTYGALTKKEEVQPERRAA